MATRTSTTSGLFSAGATWVGGVAPVNGDAVVIANTHVVNFDVDMSAWANGITLTINAGGAMTVKDDGATYYLKSNAADITVNGTWTIGTSQAVPFTGKVTVDFNGAAKSIEVSATGHLSGHLYWYCEQPTYRYITTTGALTAGVTVIIPVDTNVTGDIWAAGDLVAIADSTPYDCETLTIAAGGIAAGSITVTTAPTAAKSSASLLCLISRNIRIINVASADSAITYENITTAGNGDYIGCEIYNCNGGIKNGNGFEFAGTINCNSGQQGFDGSVRMTMSGVIVGYLSTNTYALMTCIGSEISGLFAGVARANQSGRANTISGRAFGCQFADIASADTIVTSTAVIDYCESGFYESQGMRFFGSMSNVPNGIRFSTQILLSGTLSNSNSNLQECGSGAAYNTLFTGGGTEFINYNSVYRPKSAYLESFDHNQVVNAYKAWCRGGIVTSQTASPPTGYTIWYEHACEYLATGSCPCFRQYEATVLPGTAIEVVAKIRIADGENLSTDPPALQIIDKFADPLIDSLQVPLDEDEVADATGVTSDWQDVDVIWANAGDAPRQVIVRVYASVAGVAANVDVDECWSVADYQDQIQSIYNKLPTNYIMGSSDMDNHDTDIDSILADTNEIQGKLPDDYIMGSSVTTSMDDEINAIIAITGQVHTVDNEAPGGGGTAGTSGIAEGC